MTTRITPGVGANLLGQHAPERNQDATAYVGNLDPQVSEEFLWELFVQAGPVVNVYVPKDRVTNLHQGYGFVEFRSEEDADYAIKILNMIKLYGKPIRVNKASQDKKSLDVGANLFIGNLDPDVDEKLLYDTFSAFGVIVTNPKIMRDPDTGNSRGFGFVSYDSFEASDAAIEAMNSQYLCNRAITVSYAYKKDTKGEKHGTPAERMLASSNPNIQRNRPHTLFASGPPTLTGAPIAGLPQVSGTLVPPQAMVPKLPIPFANGPPAPIPTLQQRLPPPQVPIASFPAGAPIPPAAGWLNQGLQQGQITTPAQMPLAPQHFQPPPPAPRPMPPTMPPPQGLISRPPPPVGVAPAWLRGTALPPPQTAPPPPQGGPQMQGVPPAPTQGMRPLPPLTQQPSMPNMIPPAPLQGMVMPPPRPPSALLPPALSFSSTAPPPLPFSG